jgi:CHASE3 domain sensor protein
MNRAASITRQLRVVFAVSIVILFVSSLASFLSNYKLIEASKWVNHTNEVIFDAESLVSIVKDAETAQRGYIITDDPAFLQPYNGSYEKAMKLYSQLQMLTADNPVQQPHMQKAKDLLERRYVQMDRILQSARRAAASGRSQLFVDNHEEMLAVKGNSRNDQN